MKKMRKNIGLLPLGMILVASLSGCSSGSDAEIVLRLTNCEDYMNEGSESEAFSYGDYEFDDVLLGFEEYYEDQTGKSVSIVYDTYDTNETMLSGLSTGKTEYDLICASDYTLQKMMSQQMLQPLKEHGEPFSNIPNYEEYCPQYLRDALDGLYADVDGDGEKEASVGDYSVGYMWGTLGILYNPAKVAADKGLTEDEVIADMEGSWSSLWDSKYSREMSIKDSMRDTYSVGMMKLYEDCFVNNTSTFLQDLGYSADDLGTIFNLSDEATTKEVEDRLLSLKENVFGFEVDSGKDDIVKGLVGINLAWSGDAVYSIELAAEESGSTLHYTVPKTGGNIWFDGWVMPKTCDGDNKEAALAFLDFLSDPQVASSNMGYIGYTSFISGDDIHALNLDWYDPRTYEMYAWDDDADDFVYDDDGNYVYYEGMEGSTYAYPVIDGEPSTWEAYIEENEYSWEIWDLNYMFSGMLDEEYLSEIGYENADFASSSLAENPSLLLIYGADDEENLSTRNMLYTQYPSQEMIDVNGEGELCIMQDYGTNNKYVLTMWQNVKGNNLPVWGVVVFAIILGVAVAIILATVITKRRYHKLKVARRKEASGRA